MAGSAKSVGRASASHCTVGGGGGFESWTWFASVKHSRFGGCGSNGKHQRNLGVGLSYLWMRLIVLCLQ
jgi:hypothetical protein